MLRAHAGDAGPDPAEPVLAPRTVWQRLAARVPVRLDPGRRAAVGVGLAVALAAVATAIWLAAQRPHSVAVAPSPIAGASPVASADLTLPAGPLPTGPPAANSAATAVVVDVAGKVRQPGLYRLPAGARVDDAIRRAGGPLHGVDLTSLNLAARLVDGQQILVGLPAAAPPAGVGAASDGSGDGLPAGSGVGAPVSLNAASLDQLEALPGVGPVLAQHIVDWRVAHGGFGSIEQLDDVPGIGAVKFAALRPLVTT
jgi:competence protein ComEA